MIERGEIWWAQFDAPTGSEPGFRRPVLIVQSDDLNRSRLPTVIVAALSSNAQLGREPGNVTLPAGTANLPRASVVNVTQILTIDRVRLLGHIGNLPEEFQTDVDEGLRDALSLSMF